MMTNELKALADPGISEEISYTDRVMEACVNYTSYEIRLILK